jgi:hypothetical protein
MKTGFYVYSYDLFCLLSYEYLYSNDIFLILKKMFKLYIIYKLVNIFLSNIYHN